MTCRQNGLQLFRSGGDQLDLLYSVWNKPVQRVAFGENVTEHFRGQFQFPACRLASCVLLQQQWLSLSSQLHDSDTTAGCRTSLPGGHWQIYGSNRTIYIQSFICDFVCMHILSARSPSARSGDRRAPFRLQQLRFLATLCIFLVAVLNCPEAAGFQNLIGDMFCPFSSVSVTVSYNTSLHLHNNHQLNRSIVLCSYIRVCLDTCRCLGWGQSPWCGSVLRRQMLCHMSGLWDSMTGARQKPLQSATSNGVHWVPHGAGEAMVRLTQPSPPYGHLRPGPGLRPDRDVKCIMLSA